MPYPSRGTGPKLWNLPLLRLQHPGISTCTVEPMRTVAGLGPEIAARCTQLSRRR
jgi:hypothetical protein